MAPKRKPSSKASAPKRKRAPAADWRTPVFYWRGKVVGNAWQGTWVASTDGLPSDAEFAKSPNTFKLKCSEALPKIYQMFDGQNATLDHATFTGHPACCRQRVSGHHACADACCAKGCDGLAGVCSEWAVE